jgi:hypothetical protein
MKGLPKSRGAARSSLADADLLPTLVQARTHTHTHIHAKYLTISEEQGRQTLPQDRVQGLGRRLRELLKSVEAYMLPTGQNNPLSTTKTLIYDGLSNVTSSPP